MIWVQMDEHQPGQEPGGETAIWSGRWEQAPSEGHTIQLRSGDRTDFYRVTGVDWIVRDEEKMADPVRACIVTVEEYTP